MYIVCVWCCAKYIICELGSVLHDMCGVLGLYMYTKWGTCMYMQTYIPHTYMWYMCTVHVYHSIVDKYMVCVVHSRIYVTYMMYVFGAWHDMCPHMYAVCDMCGVSVVQWCMFSMWHMVCICGMCSAHGWYVACTVNLCIYHIALHVCMHMTYISFMYAMWYPHWMAYSI